MRNQSHIRQKRNNKYPWWYSNHYNHYNRNYDISDLILKGSVGKDATKTFAKIRLLMNNTVLGWHCFYVDNFRAARNSRDLRPEYYVDENNLIQETKDKISYKFYRDRYSRKKINRLKIEKRKEKKTAKVQKVILMKFSLKFSKTIYHSWLKKHLVILGKGEPDELRACWDWKEHFSKKNRIKVLSAEEKKNRGGDHSFFINMRLKDQNKKVEDFYNALLIINQFQNGDYSSFWKDKENCKYYENTN